MGERLVGIVLGDYMEDAIRMSYLLIYQTADGKPIQLERLRQRALPSGSCGEAHSCMLGFRVEGLGFTPTVGVCRRF